MAAQQPEGPADYVIRMDDELRTWLEVRSPTRDFIPFWSENWQRPKEDEKAQPAEKPQPSTWGQGNLADDLARIFDRLADDGAHSTAAATGSATSAAQAKSPHETPEQPAAVVETANVAGFPDDPSLQGKSRWRWPPWSTRSQPPETGR